MSTIDVSTKNQIFWDELCGSQLAKFLGITDSKPESLKKFDDWYFDFYPYLFNYIPFSQLSGKSVLEIGLGYGTVAQRLAESGCSYTGLDIASGPVSMVNHRLEQQNLQGKAVQGSILNPPFEPESFDYIVAIGCLHHTGDLKAAIEQCHKLLKPNGNLIFMVYYAYSYRRFWNNTGITLNYLKRELLGHTGVVGTSSDEDRGAYDISSDGQGAPHTDWISIRSLKKLCSSYKHFEAQLENIDQGQPFQRYTREALLKTFWPKKVGLDLYATATK